MPIHVFPVESVRDSALGGDSIEHAYLMARTYLGQCGQSGETTDAYMQCADRAAVETAMDEFVEWAHRRPHDDPKVLWLSIHGAPPSAEARVGTSGASAAHRISEPDPREVVEWASAFKKLRGACPPNMLVMADVCWGASPTAPARTTNRHGTTPKLFFGPVRSAHRLELDTAAGIVFGILARGMMPTVDEAQSLVAQLNTWFPADAANGKPFYRVWWWDSDGAICHFPDAPGHKFKSRHVPPSQ